MKITAYADDYKSFFSGDIPPNYSQEEGEAQTTRLFDMIEEYNSQLDMDKLRPAIRKWSSDNLGCPHGDRPYRVYINRGDKFMWESACAECSIRLRGAVQHAEKIIRQYLVR